ncbi:hypothetical protein B4168_3025 [Anoxybacillus flavithermus]|nr:hypothetical protein B4168_3025 [Anoxybacillus flavithermus]OAO86314.1 hypothetical protein GT23_2207 [Parageobacillus thermoglucosidasius]
MAQAATLHMAVWRRLFLWEKFIYHKQIVCIFLIESQVAGE